VVFFFTPDKEGYSGSSTSFDVRDGRLTYAETADFNTPKDYTLEKFKRAIVEIVRTQKK